MGAQWWVGSIVNETQTITIWIFQLKNPKQLVQIKKLKRNLRETDSGDEVESLFSRFITIEFKSSPIMSLSPFIIEKVISSNISPKSVKKLINETLLIEVEKRKHADFLLKMTMFYNIAVKTYPHKSLNTSKGVVRSKELSLCTLEEIKKELKRQGVIDVIRVSIKKEGKTIETNTYIMTFNTPKIPEKKKRLATLWRKLSNLFLIHWDAIGVKNMDTMRTHVEDVKCAANVAKEILAITWMNVNFPVNVQIVVVTIQSTQDPAIFGGEKEILTVKYKNNIPYHEARKRVVTPIPTMKHGKG